MAKILIVDDDDSFRVALAKNLLLEGHEILTAENGVVALDVIKIEKPDVIISDIRMPEMNGVDLLRAIRSQSQVPVILMTGFSEILETQDAYQLGANEFLAKPFRVDEMKAAIQRCFKPESDEHEDAKEYCKLGINDFLTGRTIKFNIFVRLSPQKFIKVAHKGEDITMERIRFYREKGLHFLYLRRDDFKSYVGFSLTLTSAARRTAVVSPEKKLGLLRHTGEILHEHIRHDGIDEQVYQSSTAFVDATLDILTDDVKAVEVLEALRGHADHILVHSVGVCLYSVMIAQMVDWNLPSNRFKVAMGGLFHDIGMKELSRELVNRPRYSWSRDEVKVFESHPLRGITILQDIEAVSDDVREVVKQHHENCISRGFPFAVKKTSIHPMAKLISVADEFCYRVVKGPQFTQMEPMDALQDIMSNCAQQLDKRFLDALVQLFKKGPQRPPTKAV